jgi:hypothetical protein
LRSLLLRPRRLGTPLVLGVALATFAGLAVTSHGFPVQHVSLNDGGIWVTDNAHGIVGRFAKPVAQLDGQVRPASASPNVNVWQDGPAVAAYDSTGGRIYAVNVFQTDFYDAGQVISPEPDGIALGDTTLAVLSTDHALRAVTLGAGGGSLSALSATAKPLAAHLPADAAVAVGADDTIWVAGGGELRDFPAGASTPTVSSLPLSATDPMQVTTVGNVPVIADATARILYLPDSGHTVPLPGVNASSGFEFQQPSDASDVVVYATSQALYSVNLSTGQPGTLSQGHSGIAAAPVQVAGCVRAAWATSATGSYVHSGDCPPPATSATQTFPLDDTAGTPSLVFRVNNGSVVLNDTTDGEVFLVDKTVTGIKPKWQLSSIPGQSSTQSPADQAQDKTLLAASPVTQGVRPGRTTVVHVLDDVRGSAGVTCAVTAVGQPDQPGVTVAIAPDAQTVLATVTTLATDAHFQYTIDDGHGHTASSEVTLVPRLADQNAAPALRVGYQPPTLKVAASGNLVIPVIGDWRDFDGDPLYIDTNSVKPSAGSAAVTGSGALSFTAPPTAADETVTLSYGVSDGRVAEPTMASLKISVLGSSSKEFVAPVAEPSAALAVVGAPVALQPLANNLPGVDPTNRNARLTLAAPVQAVPGATVTFTAQRPGNFNLAYTAAYGAAPTATGTIRVYVLPATGTPRPPVTTPAVAVLHGQQPAVVDVLANDYDPQGWILGVTSASTASAGVRVAVIGQHWLRVSADDPVPGLTATVDYRVSDGRGSATGTVAVSAVAADPNADQITTTEAEVTIRAGDSAAVPVLVGDNSSTGLPLSIDGLPPTANPPVAGLRAGIQGGNIRISAPAGAKAEEETTVSYVATDADGTTAAGNIDVTIVPPPSAAHPDQAPVPQEVDSRETAGEVVVIPIPVDGVDPDGDSVTVTGVTTAPALGRIVAVGPDSISYQSYPGSLGTDTFGYQVTDPYGLTGTAQVRVAVLPPGLPQPPVAVNDVINAPPGASLHWNVLGNDFVAPGDKATIEPLAKTNKTLPAGVRLDGTYVYLRVPASPSDPPVEFTYGLTDGSTPSLAQVIVHAVAGAQLPPIANDVVAPPPAARATTITVNVLGNDDDPVGSPGDLRISQVPAGVTVRGGDLTVPLGAHPREVPYQITAPDGLTALAVVYVPGTAAPAIRLKPGARITLKPGGSITVPLSSVLTDSSGRQLKMTTADQPTASPAGDIAVSANQVTAFAVQALGRYTGPGAVTVQVYDGATPQDPAGQTATVTIPVLVGSGAPVLRCTADPLQVVEGGTPQGWNIDQLCQLWVGATVATAPSDYTVTWEKQIAGVGSGVPGGTSLQLTAASGAVPGATGTLLVTPVGATSGGTLNVAVIRAPLPTGSPASVTVRAGQSVAVDLGEYVTSPLAQPDIQVLGVTSPAGLTVARSGSTVTVTAAPGTAGAITLAATVTDVVGRADRAISVPVTVNVIGSRSGQSVPGAPGQPTATATSQTIVVTFASAAAGGAPIEYYTVYANGAPHQCPASPCTVTGLTNGTTYTVYVTATNSLGQGGHSPTTTARPNGVPGQVTGLATATGDGRVTLTWQPVADAGTPITGYQVEISPPPAGQSQITPAGLATSKTFTGLTDGTAYTFTVQAVSATSGNGPWSLGVTATPFGKPSPMAAPTATGASSGSVTISWTPAQDNGSPVTAYTVHEYQAASQAGPWGNQVGDQTVNGSTTSTAFTVNNGSWYEFAVTATNQAGTSASSPLSTAVQVSASPDAPTALTATAQPGVVKFSFTAGAAGGAQVSSIEYGINAATKTGTINGPFTPGTVYTETLNDELGGAVQMGTPVTVYVAECNAAGCSPWTGPSNQVTPYAALPTPTVGAALSAVPPCNNCIHYSWIAYSDGLPETLTVCINGACTGYAVPTSDIVADSPYVGVSNTTGNKYDTRYTITAYLTDTAGQRAPATGTVSSSVTTGATPAPPGTLAVTKGGGIQFASGEQCSQGGCGYVHLALANFPPNSTVAYTCTTTSGGFLEGTAGTIYSTDYSGATVKTDANGVASFDSYYAWNDWTGRGGGTYSVTCTSGTASNTVTVQAAPPTTVTISQGAANPVNTGNCPDCYSYVHLVVSGFTANSDLNVSCTTANAEWPVTATVPTAPGEGGATANSSENSAGQAVETDGSGAASFDSAIEWMGGFVVTGSSLTCEVNESLNISGTGTYTG